MKGIISSESARLESSRSMVRNSYSKVQHRLAAGHRMAFNGSGSTNFWKSDMDVPNFGISSKNLSRIRGMGCTLAMVLYSPVHSPVQPPLYPANTNWQPDRQLELNSKGRDLLTRESQHAIAPSYAHSPSSSLCSFACTHASSLCIIIIVFHMSSLFSR